MKRLKNNINNILWLCKPYWKYDRAYFILYILTSFAFFPFGDIIYIYLPERVVDLLMQGKSLSYMVFFVSIACCISFLTHMFPSFFYPSFQKKQARINQLVNKEIYEKGLATDYKFIDNPEYYNKFSWAINEYSNQVNSAREFISRFCQYFFSISVLLTIIATIGPWILLIECIQLILQAVFNSYSQKLSISQKNEMLPIDRKMGYLHRVFYLKQYAADLKTTLLSTKLFHEYAQNGKTKVDVTYKYAKKILFIGLVREAVLAITEFVIIIYLVSSIINGRIPEIGLYITMILAFYRLDSKLSEFITLLSNAQGLSLNAEKIREFFKMQSEIESADEGKAIHPADGPFSVCIKNLDFSYENSNFRLSKVNLDIRTGEKIAIVGANGVGKTTLVKLLLRLYDANNGDILYNGISIKKYDPVKLRRKIGVAFQETNVYALSFIDNLTLYDDYSRDQINEIVRKMELNSILEKGNGTIDVEMTREFNEKGVMISGGEAQKIALSRIISGEFGLLVLDEPSSALDPITEYNIMKLIMNAANLTTTIIVAHRLSTVRDADRIVVIDDGGIVEAGSHDELMSIRGKYFEMFTKQAKNYVK